jgi:hypothetical protein
MGSTAFKPAFEKAFTPAIEESNSITDSIPDSFALTGSDKTTYFLSD